MKRIPLALLFGLAGQAQAIPENSSLFCAERPSSRLCSSGTASCAVCHQGLPPSLNTFGADLKVTLHATGGFEPTAEGFRRYLSGGLTALAPIDSDRDGATNGDEIAAGSMPGDPLSVPDPTTPPRVYDQRLAFRRAELTYCGLSPSFEEMVAFAAAPDKKVAIHALVTRCLRSPYWRDHSLPRLADAKIRPIKALGVEGNPFILGDYRYDYRLFVYALSGDHDARDLLRADYHVLEDGSLSREVIPRTEIENRVVVGNGQPLVAEKRAGLVTTQWFIAVNTMFAMLPRATAAQAYRSYLGLDVAKSQGLYPVAGEPRDVDHMNVKAPACAACHATLDPLAYSFANYMGFTGGDGRIYPVGSYNPGRTPWGAQGYLFGEPVADLLDWTNRAANSPAFAQATVAMFYRHALGHEPAGSAELGDFETLWRNFMADSYSAERLIHKLVDSKSFGSAEPARVIWKRERAFVADIARALTLDAGGFCRELAAFDCGEEAFQFALGGHDPFAQGQYQSLNEPSRATPAAIERVAWHACSQRIALDKAARSPILFNQFPLGTMRASDVAEAPMRAQITALYKSFDARLPASEEEAALVALAATSAGLTTQGFAEQACFALATAGEMVFY